MDWIAVRGRCMVTLLLSLLSVFSSQAESTGAELPDPDTRIVWSPDGRYAFPISGPLQATWWTALHWDGSFAVDIRVDPALPDDAPERTRFAESDVVAVHGGIATRADNPFGGIAVMLRGDDGRTYYFAHLESSAIAGESRVEAGEVVGKIGRTGMRTQYLEPHLHFSIADGWHDGLRWEPDIHGSRWIDRIFGMTPHRVPIQPYRGDSPSGSPLFGPVQVVRAFEESEPDGRYQRGITLRARYRDSAIVRAPLTGVAGLHRATVLGTRIQISNDPGGYSVIVSGDIEPLVRNGELVYSDAVIGTAVGAVHYMILRDGEPVDPLDHDAVPIDGPAPNG